MAMNGTQGGAISPALQRHSTAALDVLKHPGTGTLAHLSQAAADAGHGSLSFPVAQPLLLGLQLISACCIERCF